MVAIGEASRLSGVSIEAIRYYERAGIVAKPARTAAGRRVYSEAGIAALRFIKRCRDLGFSIEASVALRSLATEPASCGTAEELGRRHLAEVRGKIEHLRHMEAALTELTANCAEGRTDCPMLRSIAEADA
ncbi:MerR family transcriptional regulator [Jannaschia sp. Os4]|uniref:MerR family transcriptional regulator n=1 Tax=Jannaschia sp. Os4 TaxID=2807617 RepID=UPI00193944C4|nr:MerR family transcriptional regulator [Jannaschia sp. Os4]MBM2578163.1 MerR family transcriptional regulator [Jannaschia sp. Os4]